MGNPGSKEMLRLPSGAVRVRIVAALELSAAVDLLGEQGERAEQEKTR